MLKTKFTDYNDCIDYLFNLERAGIKYDLKNIRLLLKHSGNPQNNFKSIHVAGTNGKGSVSSILNSCLIENNFRTGLYTSPHIKTFRERILVDGKFISKKFILEFINRFHREIKKIEPSFFEVTTAMAFEYFRFKKVNYAVVETGLGGRLDSTNILKPILSVITSLDIDHTDFLGKTINKITFEKAGIIKYKTPVVIGKIPYSSVKLLKTTAKEKKSAIIFSENNSPVKITKRTEKGFYFDADNNLTKVFFPVAGDYQANNIKTSLAALEILTVKENINFNTAKIKNGFKNLKVNSKFSGRFELISSRPKVVIDVSHNLQAIKNIKENLKYFKYDELIIIFAMMMDKDFMSSVNELGKLKTKKIILTRPIYKRAAEPEDLYSSVRHNKKKFIPLKNLSKSVRYAKDIASSKDLILVTGSFFLVSDFLNAYNK